MRRERTLVPAAVYSRLADSVKRLVFSFTSGRFRVARGTPAVEVLP